jgi:hypothetical protein
VPVLIINLLLVLQDSNVIPFFFSNLDINKAHLSFHQHICKISLDIHPIPPLTEELSKCIPWPGCNSVVEHTLGMCKAPGSVSKIRKKSASPQSLLLGAASSFLSLMIWLLYDLHLFPDQPLTINSIISTKCSHFKISHFKTNLPTHLSSGLWMPEFGCLIFTENTRYWKFAALDPLNCILGSCSLDCTDLVSHRMVFSKLSFIIML